MAVLSDFRSASPRQTNSHWPQNLSSNYNKLWSASDAIFIVEHHKSERCTGSTYGSSRELEIVSSGALKCLECVPLLVFRFRVRASRWLIIANQTTNLAELCALLVDETYGELASVCLQAIYSIASESLLLLKHLRSPEFYHFYSASLTLDSESLPFSSDADVSPYLLLYNTLVCHLVICAMV